MGKKRKSSLVEHANKKAPLSEALSKIFYQKSIQQRYYLPQH